ncbi:hypothetical protein [Stakelama marina]|uniref:Uncharacterized protein n=1 Tax=Stakelama marina TaxID=2826939 RepID=A0A8T4IID1_9SPHN|nr:hypothetical protein [Stakelama marina]MBR0553644.1 hypothetical protein [Stakelama marina]
MDLIYLERRHRMALDSVDAATHDIARASHASLAGLYAEWIQQLKDEAAGLPTEGKFPIRRT